MSKGLNALEFVKTMPHENGGEVGIYATDKWATIEKELKALEIIIRTRLNVGTFLLLCKGNNEFSPNTTYEQYCYFCDKENIHQFPCYKMTKEEYELVLGVLYEKEHRDKNTH